MLGSIFSLFLILLDRVMILVEFSYRCMNKMKLYFNVQIPTKFMKMHNFLLVFQESAQMCSQENFPYGVCKMLLTRI